MAPAEFSDDDITAIGESIADEYWVITSLDVVFPVFFIFSHDGGGVRRRVRPGVRHFPGIYEPLSLQRNGLITSVADSSVCWAEFIEISKEKKKRESDEVSDENRSRPSWYIR